MTVVLELPVHVKSAIWSHLFPGDEQKEAAAFAFVRHTEQDAQHLFEYREWYAVPPEGFEVRTGYHIELTDETRATVIKQAHDLDSSVVEFHSHLGPWPAAFSPSDQMGLAEFVPHVRWRLRGRPYLAIVATRSDFDGLAWIDKSPRPARLDAISVDGQLLIPTRLSSLEDINDQQRATR